MNTPPVRPQARLSALLVLLLTLAALGLGWLVKLQVEGPARIVSQAGISLAVPSGWAVTAGPPGQLLVCWNVLAPEHRCSVSLLPSGEDVSLATVASQRQFQRGATLSYFRVLDQTPVLVKGREGYKVAYAFVDPGATGQLPVVVEGAEYYFPLEGQVVVLTFEDNAATFEQSSADFQRMLGSITFEETGRGEGN